MKDLLSYIKESVFDTLDKSEEYDNDFIIRSLVQDFFSSQLNKSEPAEYSLKNGKLTTQRLKLRSDGEEKASEAMQHLQDMGAVTEIDCDHTNVYGYKEVNQSIFTNNLTTGSIGFYDCGNCRDVNINIRDNHVSDYPVYIEPGRNQETHFDNVTINYDRNVSNKVIRVGNSDKKIMKLTGIRSNAEYITQMTNGTLPVDLSQILEPNLFNVCSKRSGEITEISPASITKTISEINKTVKARAQIFGSYPLKFKKGVRFSNFIQDTGLPDLKAYFICNSSVGLLFLAPDKKADYVDPRFMGELIPRYRIGEVRVSKKPTPNHFDIMPRPISADGWELVICKMQSK